MSTIDPRLASLFARISVPSRLLGPPGPTAQQLNQMLQAAVHVPDHGQLKPWRFLTISDGARNLLGELLVKRAIALDPNAPAAVLDKDRARFSYAPVIVTVIARLTLGHKIPEQEQLLSAGCVCFSLLQAAHALGFGAQWLTGWAAYDEVICQHLGISNNERIVGFIHIGTAAESVSDRARPDPAALVSVWSP